MKPPIMLAAGFGLVMLGFAAGWVLNTPGADPVPGDVAIEPSSILEPRALAGGTQPRSGTARAGDFSSRLHDLASVGSPSRRARIIDGVADDLTATEVRAALAAIETKGLRGRDEVRLQLLARWAELEPEAALEYARRLPRGYIAPGAIEIVVRTWFSNDPVAAEKGVGELLPERFARQIAVSALIESISETDPQRAFAMVREIASPAWAVDVLFQRWSESNPREAAAHATQLPPGFARDLALRRATARFAETDREGALAWAQSIPGSHFAGGTIERREPGPLATVLQTWMSEDPEATLQWLHLLPDDTAKTDVLAVLSKEFADTQPDRAIEFAVMMPDGNAQDSALQTAVGKWGQKDFAGALAWAQEQDPEVQQTLLPQLVRQLAPRDVSAALELALSIGGKAGTGAVNNVVAVWATKEPMAAATWAAAQPTNATYLAILASRWVLKDEPSAREWINALPAGPSKDGAVLRAVREIARSDEPRIAEQWIAQIKDEAQRNLAYRELAFFWLQTDSKAAGAWILTAPIPAKTKSDLLKRATK